MLNHPPKLLVSKRNRENDGRTNLIVRHVMAGGVCAILTAPSPGQTQVWIREFAVPGGGWQSLNVTPDGAGGVFIAGSTSGSVGGPAAGDSDAWVARYHESGARLWAQQIGSAASDRAQAVAADGAGGVYICGYTTGSLAAPNQGGQDSWFARYDAAGTQLWIRQIGTSTGQESANGIAPDGAGGFFVGGEGTVGGPWQGGVDAWLARYAGAGKQIWVRSDSTTVHDWRNGVVPDGAGGAFMAGRINPVGTADVWLTRYDATGLRQWVTQFGTGLPEYTWAVASDGSGGALLGGWTRGSLAAPFAGGLTDAWIARYDGAGGQTWILQFGTSDDDQVEDIASDGEGGALAVGLLQSTPNGASWFHARFDSIGTQTWIQYLPRGMFGQAIALREGGGHFLTGNRDSDSFWLARYADTCYPDCNSDGQLTVADFGCFQTKFVAADPYADCNADGQRTVADFGCFQTRFVAGCP